MCVLDVGLCGWLQQLGESLNCALNVWLAEAFDGPVVEDEILQEDVARMVWVKWIFSFVLLNLIKYG